MACTGFRALLVEDSGALCRVINYSHLNPVRARIIPASLIKNFGPSSLPAFVSRHRPPWLVAEVLSQQLGLEDTSAGWDGYLEYLVGLTHDTAQQEAQHFEEMTRGWAIGSLGWKALPLIFGS